MSPIRAATENGDRAFTTTLSRVIDFFVGATRDAPVERVAALFRDAWNENRTLAFYALLSLRDCRDGKGERFLSRMLVAYLHHSAHPTEPAPLDAALVNVIKQLGCYRDFLVLDSAMGVPCIGAFVEDLRADAALVARGELPRTLAGKWAPTEGGAFTAAAQKLRKALGMSWKEYRSMLTKLRSGLQVVEAKMSAGDWQSISFAAVPARAHRLYRDAFARDCNAEQKMSAERQAARARYQEYLGKLERGEARIKVAGTQPHELVQTCSSEGSTRANATVEAQWRALVERVRANGAFENAAAVVDVSGSMAGQPMEVAIALGLVLAECTSGVFHDKIITFERQPTIVELSHLRTLRERVSAVKLAPWGGNTCLEAVFDLLLAQATSCKKPVPMTLFIFTDMQFDEAMGYDGGRSSWSRFSHTAGHGDDSDSEDELSQDTRRINAALGGVFAAAKAKYAAHGMALPRIVCWNLRSSYSESFPITRLADNVLALSGFSSELMKFVLECQEFSPEGFLCASLEQYQKYAGQCAELLDSLPSLSQMTQDTVRKMEAVKSESVRLHKPCERDRGERSDPRGPGPRRIGGYFTDDRYDRGEDLRSRGTTLPLSVRGGGPWNLRPRGPEPIGYSPFF